jgi:hypothetical protein
MSNIPTSSVDGDRSKNVDHEESPPSYIGLNPLLNKPNNPIQPQAEWKVNHPDTHCVLRVTDPELNNIQNYQGWSILNILCCCWCLGCVACYYSCKTDSFISKGNIQSALSASRNARTINIIATVLGIIIILINIIYFATKS